MRQTCPPAPLLTWSRDFPAVPPQAREARLFLAALLGGRRDADEALLCLSELVGNACLHRRSREPGGRFTVRAQLRGGQLRVEVRDGGGQWGESRCPDDLHGRGLVIVSRLARRCGRSGNGQSGLLVWFEMDCPPGGPAGGSPDCPAGGPLDIPAADALDHLPGDAPDCPAGDPPRGPAGSSPDYPVGV
jgi:hypothetical protein